jgi:putative glutamine amidotransferase
VGDGLAVTGRAHDELVEAFEDPAARFLLGVQWHPEADERSRVVSALVDAVRERRR